MLAQIATLWPVPDRHRGICLQRAELAGADNRVRTAPRGGGLLVGPFIFVLVFLLAGVRQAVTTRLVWAPLLERCGATAVHPPPAPVGRPHPCGCPLVGLTMDRRPADAGG
jgi:hypothetical protein